MYCSINDVRNRNTLILSEDAVTDQQITDNINTSQSIVDGMLADSYSVPVSPIPNIIKAITADLAASMSISNVTANNGANESPTQAKQLEDHAMTLLRQIQSGKLTLQTTTTLTPQKTTIKSTTYYKKRKFNTWNPADPNTFI